MREPSIFTRCGYWIVLKVLFAGMARQRADHPLDGIRPT
jgi:hypothetical protein